MNNRFAVLLTALALACSTLAPARANSLVEAIVYSASSLPANAVTVSFYSGSTFVSSWCLPPNASDRRHIKDFPRAEYTVRFQVHAGRACLSKTIFTDTLGYPVRETELYALHAYLIDTRKSGFRIVMTA